MPAALDLTGQRFGRLVTLRPVAGSRRRTRRWVCVCDCGNETEAATDKLRSGEVRSCGCLRSENSTRLANALGDRRGKTKHGYAKGTQSPTYRSWTAMLARCRNPARNRWDHYGGRGITVCARWDVQQGGSFENFLADMGERPPDRTLDRINVDGNYEPGNCRWATTSEQQRNRRLTTKSLGGA